MKIFWFSLTSFEHLLEHLIPLLSPDEKDIGDRFRFEYLRQRYQLTHGVLRLLLAQYLNCEPQAIEFTYTAKGKPLIVPNIQSQNLEFNLSHSQDLALIGISSSGQIGVDVEYCRLIDNPLQLAKRFFSEQEYQLLQNSSVENQVKLFFQLWTAKEAYLKATGAGLSGGLDQVQIALTPVRFTSIYGSFELAQQWNLSSFELITDYQAAIAVEKGENKINFNEQLEIIPILPTLFPYLK